MVGTILLIIFLIMCVLLLLPVRLKASFGDGKWAVSVYYTFFRVFHKESEEKPIPETPPKPNDHPEGEAPPQPEQPVTPKPAADTAAKPETVTAPQKPEAQSDADRPEPETAAAPAKESAPKQKKKRKEKDSAAEDAAESKEKPQKRGFIQRLKPQSLDEVLGLAQDACAALSPALRFLTRHLHFRHIRLYLAVGSDDPAGTATLYGKICAAAYNLLAALQCWVDIETDEFRILADFYNESITFRAAAELRVSPMAAIWLVLILGVKFLWRTLCRFHREDKEAKRRVKETAPAAVSAD